MITDTILGVEGGLKKSDISKLTQRDTFSEFLPWLGYRDKNNSYLNTDNTIGYMWECTPLTFMGLREIKQIEQLLRGTFPKGAVMQFILYPDPYIGDFLADYRANKTRKDDLVQKTVEEYAKYLEAGTSGLKALHGIPVRNFRAFVCLKSEEKIPVDTISLVEETLSGAHMNPKVMPAGELIKWMRRFFNGAKKAQPENYDKSVPIRKQIINAETEIEFNKTTARIGGMYGRCLTPKANPKMIDPLKTNKMVGGIMGGIDDSEQITTPFLWSVNVIFDDVKSEIANKASLTMMQRGTGSFAKKIQKRVEEFGWALDKLETDKFIKIIPSLWVFADSEDELRDSSARAKRMWENFDFVMQEESRLSKVMLISSLPFGLYAAGQNINLIDRDFLVPTSTAARFLPMQGDFRGASRPVLPYIGRKGQTIGVDLFDERSNNHNFVIAAESGSGKSFGLNFLANNYYASGALVRIVDIGYSYKKLCATNHGRFMDFGEEKIVINPFFCSSDDQEDIEENQSVTSNIIAEMAYSASGATLHETEWTLIKNAVEWAIKKGLVENGINSVQDYLRTFPKYANTEYGDLDFAISKARELAFNLNDFTSEGRYGRFFNGPSTFDISSDEFVVLELDRLKSKKELFTVVVMQVMNSVTQDLYLSDRQQQRFILFEEAASFLKSNGVHDLSRLSAIIEEGYRRARKYHGSFGVVLQSILDASSFGTIGDVILNNAAYKFYLEGKDYQKAVDEGILNYKGLDVDLVTSIKNNKPRYSEMYLDTPFGRGAARLAVDPWTYWVNTSAGKEVAAFEALVKQGFQPLEALVKLSGVKI